MKRSLTLIPLHFEAYTTAKDITVPYRRKSHLLCVGANKTLVLMKNLRTESPQEKIASKRIIRFFFFFVF